MADRNSITTNNAQAHANSTPDQSCNLIAKANSQFLETENIRSRLLLINQAVLNYLETAKGNPEILYEAAHHLIVAGGKRLRSLVTLICCEAVGGTLEKVLPITVAAELLQTASLIHDDIIDKDDLRRGVQTVHMKYGHDIAILAGDFLIAQALRIIGEYGSPELISNMGSSGIRMCEGEVADLFINPENVESFTKEEYLKMVERKTVAFLEEAARTGAIIGEANPVQRKALSQYGAMLGFAFQLRDDILDIKATQQTIQKSTFSDLRLKRGNYPLIHALENSTHEERKECMSALDNADWNQVLRLITKTDAIKHTMQLAQDYAEKAKRALRGHDFQNQDLLEKLADFALLRES